MERQTPGTQCIFSVAFTCSRKRNPKGLGIRVPDLVESKRLARDWMGGDLDLTARKRISMIWFSWSLANCGSSFLGYLISCGM